MAINFLLKRSNTASKRPTAAQLDIGELSLNYEQNTCGVYFEDSNGDVRKVGPVEVSSSAPNSTPAGSSGNSLGELWYDTGSSNLKVWTGASFVSATSSVAAGGSDTQVQFNSTGSLSGSANFTFDGTSASIAGLVITGTSTFRAAATQDGVKIVGRAGGTSDYDVTITPTTLSADRTLTLADGDTTLQAGTMAITGGKLDQFAATTSAELAGVISDETGSGALVFASSPTLVTPVLGTPSSGDLSNCTNVPAGQLSGTIPSGVLGNSTVYIGTTAVALNRSSGLLSLTGIGNIEVNADSLYDLGTTGTRWRAIYVDDVYTGDLHMKNDRGDYTLIEEEDALTIRNNKTGKVYNIMMTEREV
jgi:hypothetical protein